MKRLFQFGLLLAALAWCGASARSQTFVTGSGANASSGAASSLVVTIQSTTAGDLIDLLVGYQSSSITATAACNGQSMTKTTSSPATQSSFPMRSYHFYILSATGGQTSCVVTLTGSSEVSAASAQFTGGTWTFDKDSTGTGNSGALAVTSFSPTNNPTVVTGGGGDGATGGTWTAGTGYTIPTGASLVTASRTSIALEYNLAESGATTTPLTRSVSSAWSEVAAAFKFSAGGGGGGATVPPQQMSMGVGD